MESQSMNGQEREYLLENARRMERLEETPAVPSGRCSDMTEVEKEKLIDYLFAQNECLQAKLAGLQEELRLQREQSAEHHRSQCAQLNRMEERAEAAEKRAEASERRAESADKRIAELTAALSAALDGSVLRDLREQLAKAEKQRDDALASDKSNRAQRFGKTSQKMTGHENNDSNDSDGADDDNRPSSTEEKGGMGGKDSVKKLPPKRKTTEDPENDDWVNRTFSKPLPLNHISGVSAD